MAGDTSEFNRLLLHAIETGIEHRLHSFQKATFRELQWSPYEMSPEVLELHGTGHTIEHRNSSALEAVRLAWKAMFDANKAQIESAVHQSAPVQAALAIKNHRRISFELRHVRIVAEPHVLYFNRSGTPLLRATTIGPKPTWLPPLATAKLKKLKRLRDGFEPDPDFDLSDAERAGLICCVEYFDDTTNHFWRADAIK